MAGNYRQGRQHEYQSPFGDTTFTKVFVGGLPWETPTEKMRAYFQQFGEILEAVIICDKNTGKSKGYGFVTFRDPSAAQRACMDANPYIDGRRANCNIASFGRPRPSSPRSGGNGGGAQGQGQASSSSYSGMPTLQQTLPPPYFYTSYAGGYAAYTPYGYQGIYNPTQVQQSQYYGPYYGGSSSSSPYYYGYSRVGYGSSTHTPAHRISTPSLMYYPTHMEGGTPFPTFPNPPHPVPSTPPSSTAAVTRIQITSTPGTGEAEAQQNIAAQTDSVVISSEEPTNATTTTTSS